MIKESNETFSLNLPIFWAWRLREFVMITVSQNIYLPFFSKRKLFLICKIQHCCNWLRTSIYRRQCGHFAFSWFVFSETDR